MVLHDKRTAQCNVFGANSHEGRLTDQSCSMVSIDAGNHCDDSMIQTHHRLLLLPPLLLSLFLCGCDYASAPNSGLNRKEGIQKLRILRPRQVWGLLPSDIFPQSKELSLVERFAASAGMKPEYVYVERYDQLVPSLLRGEGDLIIDNLTVTPSGKRQIRFTTPITYVSEQIITRRGEAPKSPRELAGRSVAVHASSPYYDTLRTLQQKRYQPAFKIQLVDESVTSEAILIGVAEGVYDLAIADSSLFELISSYRKNLEVAFDLGSVRAIAWGVHPDNPSLLSRLNDFLGQHHLASKQSFIASDDLEAIKQRGVLRVLTRNNPTTYFLWRGELLGFEYELARHFAEQNNLRLEMIVPPSRDQLLSWLRQGKGDIIAASMPINDKLDKKGIHFSRPYNQSSEILISRSDEMGLERSESLSGRTVVVPQSSPSWQTLKKLQAQGINLTLVAAPEDLETGVLIDKVANGEYDLTVANSHTLDIELTWRDDVKAAFPLDAPKPHGWLVRENNPQLLQAVNNFFKKEYRGLFYNVTYRKYFKKTKRNLQQVVLQSDIYNDNRLSPYDGMVKKYAKKYGFDWRLLVSQMYQESRFEPGAKSWMGAMGLMQVMPRTAMELGLEDLHQPEIGLHAGVKYLHWLMRRFEPELPVADRTWFALASYNAGIGHVLDARRLARKLSLDPNQWFSNVEKAMLLLSNKDYAKNARHGYVRGYEPVNYVREIRDRYQAYLLLAGSALNTRHQHTALN